MNLLSSLLKFTADTLGTLKTAVTNYGTRLGTAETKVTNMEAQLATAISAVTVDSEVQNIRVGDDNVTYQSAGIAVRTQFADVKSDLIRNSERLFDFDLDFSLNGYLNNYGNLISSNSYKSTKYLKVSGGDIVNYSLYGSTSAYLLVFATDFSVNPPVGLVNNIVGIDLNTPATGTFTAPSDGYIRMCCSKSYLGNSEPYVYFNNNNSIPMQIQDLDDAVSVLPDLIDDFDVYVKANSIPSTEDISVRLNTDTIINVNTGATSSAGSTSWVASDMFDVSEGEQYLLNVTMRFNNAIVAFYDSNGTFISSIAGNTGETIASNTYQFTGLVVTVPSSAKKMRIGYYSAYTHTYGKLIGYKLIADGDLSRKWLGKKWVCVGDSLTAENSATTKHYFDYVSDDTGITTVNMGVNGTGYAKSSASGSAFYDRVANVPSDADVVTIFGSFNDLSSGLDIGSVDDTGTATIAGCINTTISNLQTVIPLVNLGIVAPTPWDTTQPNFVETSNSYKYWNMLKSICERRSIPFLDLWHYSNLRPWDADFRALAYSNDGGSGTHPDENGHKLIAPRFKAFLESLLI